MRSLRTAMKSSAPLAAARENRNEDPMQPKINKFIF